MQRRWIFWRRVFMTAVDYMQTLRVYLDLEMNSSAAAKRLFLHRSSFLKRLERIKEAVGEKLETADGRFLLRWLLRLVQR